MDMAAALPLSSGLGQYTPKRRPCQPRIRVFRFIFSFGIFLQNVVYYPHHPKRRSAVERRSVTTAVTAAFLLSEGVIYGAFLALDLTGQNYPALWLKDSSVLLCLGISLFFAFRGGDRLIALAMGFAVAADAFLLIAGEYWPAGILLFLCVQTVCLIRLRLWGAPSALPLRAGLTLLPGLILHLSGQATLLNLLAALYFAQLLSNTILAWHIRRFRFAAALTLFVCCDVCIGLYHILPLSPTLSHMTALGMWLFYLPAQVIFVLCAKEVSYENR